MAHDPLLAVAVAPKLGAGHVEDAPVAPPLHRLVLAVGLAEERHDLGLVGVHFGEPRFGGLAVVHAANAPVGLDLQIVLEVKQQVIARHLTAGEEILRHPVGIARGLEVVGIFAMGENVKRSTSFAGPGAAPPRYPRTRMGVVETMRDAFMRAKDYRQAWADFRSGKSKVQPRKDLELEPLVEILEGKRLVHAHGYRSDEHLNLLLLADEMGFKVATLQHGLEAYKIAPEIAKRGTGVSIFSDYWGYKLEAYDAIPYNAYILWKNGVNVSINSDDDGRMRRLNLDAAKVMKYGGVPEEDALKMITINPAKQLGIDKRTGSVENGKDGDLVIWTGHPFSPYSRVESTFVDGEMLFDRSADAKMRVDVAKEREALEKLDINKAPATGGTPPRVPADRRRGDRDEAEAWDGGNQ